jgi:hypothetical protein
MSGDLFPIPGAKKSDANPKKDEKEMGNGGITQQDVRAPLRLFLFKFDLVLTDLSLLKYPY